MQKQVILTLLLFALPAAASRAGFQDASGTLPIGSTTGHVTVATLNFTPKAGLFLWNAQANQNTAGTAVSLGIGSAVSPSNRAAVFHRRLQASNVVFSHQIGTNVLTGVDLAGAVNFSVDLVSWNPNGFTLNVVTAPGVNFYVQWYVFGGSEFEANLVQFNSPTSPGSVPVTGMGFQADALIIFSAGMTATVPTIDGNARFGLGFVDGALNQVGLGNRQVHNTSTSRRSQSTSSAIYIPDTNSMWLEGAVTLLGPDGFNVNYTTVQAAATVKLWALGLRGVRAHVNWFNTAGSLGTQGITSVEHQPDMVLMASFCRTPATGQVNNGELSIGGATATAQGNNAIAHTQGGLNTGHANYDNQILTCLVGGTPTIEVQASFISLDPRGFTINNTTVAANTPVLFMTISPLPVSRMLIAQGLK